MHPKKIEPGDTPFHVGQVWAYRTRPQEPASTLTIVAIDADPKLGNIVHIHVQNLRVRCPQRRSGFAETIGHSPVSEEALRESVTRLVGEASELPDYRDGYDQWRAAFDAGRAGVFTLPVSEIVEAIETAINPGEPA